MKKTLFIVLVIASSFSEEFPKSLPTLGIYDNFYSKSEWAWTWYKDSNVSAMLLKHKHINKCFIAANLEPLDYDNGDWNLKSTVKKFGKTKYRVFRIELNGYLWCYTYSPENDPKTKDQLNVYMDDYSCKACLKAAEKILLNRGNNFNNPE